MWDKYNMLEMNRRIEVLSREVESIKKEHDGNF